MKNREQTKQRIINAVGEIFRTQGTKGLYITNIARTARVDRSLIYQYFGKNVKHLIEAYILQKDYWIPVLDDINSKINQDGHDTIQTLMTEILQKQWTHVSGSGDLQKLILWELSGESELLRSIHRAREIKGEQILELTDQQFKNSLTKFRPIAVLLLGGIYYANIHAVQNGHKICGMDIRSVDGQQAISNAIGQIIAWAYTAVS